MTPEHLLALGVPSETILDLDRCHAPHRYTDSIDEPWARPVVLGVCKGEGGLLPYVMQIHTTECLLDRLTADGICLGRPLPNAATLKSTAQLAILMHCQ